MAKKDKVYIPAGVGGLIKYSEEEKTFIKLKPSHFIILVMLIAIIELLFSLY